MDAAQIKKKLEEWNEFISRIKENPEGEPPDFSEVTLPHKAELVSLLDRFKSAKDLKALKKCSLLLRFAYDNINILESITKETPALSEAICAGEIKEAIEGSQELADKLKRLGINNNYSEGKILPAGRLVPIEENGRLVFLEESKVMERENLKKELKELALRIQVMNAKRQIAKLPEGEEKEYEELQKKYIELSKKLERMASPL